MPASSPSAGLGAQVPLLSPPLHPGKRLHDRPPVAPGLQLQGTDSQPSPPNPDFSAGLREDPTLPRGVLKLCVKKLGKLDGF